MNKFLDGNGLRYLWGKIRAAVVPVTRKVCNKALSTDITLTASDVGAATMVQVNEAIDTAINNAMEGSY